MTVRLIRTGGAGLLAAGLWVITMHAVAAAKESSMKFHGTLVVVECSINDGERRAVNFGDAVGIHRIDGKRYEQPVPFSLDCQNYAGGDMPALTLTLEGTPAYFDEAAVATDVTGLGIEIRRNGEAQPLNKAVQFDYKSVPVLTAVPVADPKVTLDARTFSATVKLTVEVA